MPPAVPYRDRPVLEHIVEQHAEEAAFLWTLRDAATDAPHYKRHHLARLDERVEAHVDGLRVAGEAGWRIALEQLERRCEKGELFATALLALESGDMRRIEPLAARAEAEPEARRGFVGAVAWCRPELLTPTVRSWALSTQTFNRYLALCACSVHRAAAGPKLRTCLDDGDARVRARALRLAGELGRVELLDVCLSHLDNSGGDARFWAAWSAVLLGDRGAASQALRKIMLADTPRRWTALEVVIRAMGAEHGFRVVRALNGEAGLRRIATVALGHLGDPSAVPWLIERMKEPEIARAAGESFAMISGADLAFEDLDLAEAPSAGAASAQSEDPSEDRAEVHSDGFLPWPDPARAGAWWEGGRARMPPGRRHLLGLPIGAEAAEHAWKAGFQRQRRAAAIELALLRPGEPLREYRARAK